jgi:hypothetical protein
MVLGTVVEIHIRAQGAEPKDFSTVPPFNKPLNLSVASND